MNLVQRRFIFGLLLTMVLISCKEEKPERDPNDWRTPQYIDDSTVCADYIPMFDSILVRLPAGMHLGEQCSADIKRRVKLFRDSMPYMLFQPQEFVKTGSFRSYFRFDRLQKDFDYSPEGTFTLPWRAMDYSQGASIQTQYFMMAESIREVMDNQYICVFINNEAKYKKPELDSIEEKFNGGEITGTAVIVDFITGKPLCSFEVHAENSELVNVQTHYENKEFAGDDPLSQLMGRASQDGVVVDLWYNLAFEIERKLNE